MCASITVLKHSAFPKFLSLRLSSSLEQNLERAVTTPKELLLLLSYCCWDLACRLHPASYATRRVGLGRPKSPLCFSVATALEALSCLKLHSNLLDCIVTAVTSVCIFKKFVKTGEFLCSHFNSENGRRYATCLSYYALLFQKGKNAKNKICAVCGEGAVIHGMCQKWFVKFLGTTDILAK